MDDDDDDGDDASGLPPDVQAALAAGGDARARALLGAHAERHRQRLNEMNREATFLHWSQQVRAELEATEHDPLRRRVLEYRRQIALLRDAEETLRTAVDRWPVLRRDAFPPGPDVDRAFAAVEAATLVIERAADEMTSALWGTIPPGRKAEAHAAMQKAVLDTVGPFPTFDDWLARDREKMHRRACEAETEGRHARGHHVETADVDELIVRKLVSEGVSEDDALRATIDTEDRDTREALQRRKEARRKWKRRNGQRRGWRVR